MLIKIGLFEEYECKKLTKIYLYSKSVKTRITYTFNATKPR